MLKSIIHFVKDIIGHNPKSPSNRKNEPRNTEDQKKIFALKLDQFISENYSSKREFANEINVTQRMLSNYLSAKAFPGVSVINKMSKAGFDINESIKGISIKTIEHLFSEKEEYESALREAYLLLRNLKAQTYNKTLIGKRIEAFVKSKFVSMHHAGYLLGYRYTAGRSYLVDKIFSGIFIPRAEALAKLKLLGADLKFLLDMN